MNVTGLRTRSLTKGLAYLLALTVGQSEFQSSSSEDSRSHPINLISVSEVQRDETSSQEGEAEQVCPQWKMTREEAVFVLSESQSIDEQAYYRELEKMPCKVTGELLFDGKLWNYVINAGAGVRWLSGEEYRYFGCMTEACDVHMLMPYPRLGNEW